MLGLGVGVTSPAVLRRGGVSPVALATLRGATALPAFLTHSRAGGAMMFDSTGKLTWAPENLLLNSATLSTQNVTTIAANYIVSFSGTGTIALSGASTSDPLVGTGASDRVYLKFTPTAGTLTLTVSGSVTSAQLERVTYEAAPRTYNPTTSAAYYAPRFDYDPAALTSRGLLLEGSRTNIRTASQLESGYGVGAATLTPNASAGIDGNTSAATFVPTAVNAQHFLYKSAVFLAGTYTHTLYVRKLGTNNYYINYDPVNSAIGTSSVFDIDSGTVLQVGHAVTSAEIVNLGGGLYKIIVVYAHPATTSTPVMYGCTSVASRIYPGDGTSGWVLDSWQIEAGNFGTSYIKAASTTVTRATDSVAAALYASNPAIIQYRDLATGVRARKSIDLLSSISSEINEWIEEVAVYPAGTSSTYRNAHLTVDGGY